MKINEEDIVIRLKSRESMSSIAKDYKVGRAKIANIAHKNGIYKNTIKENETFGRLTTIRIVYTDYYGKVWLCKCSCGKEVEVSGSRLKSGGSKSCGCLRKEMHKCHEEIRGAFWQSIKNGAKSRGIEFNITIDKAWEIFIKQERKCALTDIKIDFGPMKNWTQTASLDRIDSSKGYTEDNVQWVHKIINRMKHDLPENIFISLCRKVVKKHKNNNAKISNPRK